MALPTSASSAVARGIEMLAAADAEMLARAATAPDLSPAGDAADVSLYDKAEARPGQLGVLYGTAVEKGTSSRHGSAPKGAASKPPRHKPTSASTRRTRPPGADDAGISRPVSSGSLVRIAEAM